MSRRHPNIANLEEMPWHEGATHGNAFGYRDKWCADETGAKQIGASYYELEPGKRAFPHHTHLVNEEALFVIDGEGTLRLGIESYPVGRGDYIALLAGLEHAHQLVNSGKTTLRYLCLSTRKAPDVAIHVDSGKIAVLGGDAVKIREMYWRKDRIEGQSAYFKGENG